MENTQQASILIVDDNSTKAIALESALADLNLNIVKCFSGNEALRQLLKQNYAVILLDVKMPGMDGFDTARLIRQREKSKHTPIIFVTAFDNTETELARGYSLGAVDYILSPIVPEVLRAKVLVFVDLFRINLELVCQAKKMSAINEELEKEISERKKAEDDFKKLNRELENRVSERTIKLESANRELEKEIVERMRISEQMQIQFHRTAALRRIDMTITSSMDLRLTLNMLLDQVVTQLSVDAADILLFNQYSQLLVYYEGHGFRSNTITHTRLRLGEDYAGRSALERRTIHIKNLTDEIDSFNRVQLMNEEGFITYFTVPLISKGHIKGVLEVFTRKLFEPDPSWLDFLETLAGQAAIAIDNISLFNDLQYSNAELTLAYDSTLEGWIKALDLRDKETEGHSDRVMELTLQLTRAMGINEAELIHVRRGALLHDIGKLGIPDNILLKPGPLTEEELTIMRYHPVFAHELLSYISYLHPALDIPHYHHEKWDGTGYPRGLKGNQIPLVARIFSVVDVYDALCSDRPYRKAWPVEKAKEYIRANSESCFDPKVVDIFLNKK